MVGVPSRRTVKEVLLLLEIASVPVVGAGRTSKVLTPAFNTLNEPVKENLAAIWFHLPSLTISIKD
jgi:hypothetical protein